MFYGICFESQFSVLITILLLKLEYCLAFFIVVFLIPEFAYLKFKPRLLQAVGIIAAIGDAVRNLKIGMPAAIMTFGGYAEFVMVTTALHIYSCQV